MNPELSLRSPRLDLVATTLEHIETELNEPHALTTRLGASIPPSWPPGEYDRNALEFFRDQLTAGGPSHVGWFGWYALTRNAAGLRDTLVAGAGYMGPPAGRSVEIGFSVIPEARGLGYATELVETLVAHAFRHADIDRVMAHTTDSNVASTKVLLKSGFTRMGNNAETVEYCRKRPA